MQRIDDALNAPLLHEGTSEQRELARRRRIADENTEATRRLQHLMGIPTE